MRGRPNPNFLSTVVPKAEAKAYIDHLLERTVRKTDDQLRAMRDYHRIADRTLTKVLKARVSQPT